MISKKLTYANSGVNINKADKFVKFISSKSRKSKKSGDFKNIGGFGAVSDIPKHYKNPQLVTSTDGVGTKIEIANEIKKYDTIGIDLVAMCVNDLIVLGAKPFLFLDYISIDKVNLKKLKSIIKGVLKGCEISGCKLVGGETAEMPGTYNNNKFDIAGFSVGVLEKKEIIKNNIKANDVIIGIPSNGIHSNGYSLIRHILKLKNINLARNRFLKNEFIKPTRIYVKEILKLNKLKLINGCAHITGGGLHDNIKIIIPKKLNASIDLSKIKPLRIFKWIKKQGISDSEMIKTFNCGVGFCIITKKKNLKKISKIFPKNYKPYVLGSIKKGSSKVSLNGKINW